MPLLIQQPTAATDAFERAAARDVLPSALSSREQRDTFEAAVREMAVFSARTTNAEYLQTMRGVLNQVAQGDMGMGEARVILQQTLISLGYTPEGGFPTQTEDGRQKTEDRRYGATSGAGITSGSDVIPASGSHFTHSKGADGWCWSEDAR